MFYYTADQPVSCSEKAFDYRPKKSQDQSINKNRFLRYSKIITKSVFAIFKIENLISLTFRRCWEYRIVQYHKLFEKVEKYRKVMFCNYVENRCDVLFRKYYKNKKKPSRGEGGVLVCKLVWVHCMDAFRGDRLGRQRLNIVANKDDFKHYNITIICWDCKLVKTLYMAMCYSLIIPSVDRQ